MYAYQLIFFLEPVKSDLTITRDLDTLPLKFMRLYFSCKSTHGKTADDRESVTKSFLTWLWCYGIENINFSTIPGYVSPNFKQ